MNISLLTTPLFRSPHVVVVWECKNSFFCIPRNTLAHFFLFFLHFFVILLCINKIKMHFSCFWPSRDPVFGPFLALSGLHRRSNFADFLKISAKIEHSLRTIWRFFCVILCNLLIICVLYILCVRILLYINFLYVYIRCGLRYFTIIKFNIYNNLVDSYKLDFTLCQL